MREPAIVFVIPENASDVRLEDYGMLADAWKRVLLQHDLSARFVQVLGPEFGSFETDQLLAVIYLSASLLEHVKAFKARRSDVRVIVACASDGDEVPDGIIRLVKPCANDDVIRAVFGPQE
jgi:hypothetical protein